MCCQDQRFETGANDFRLTQAALEFHNESDPARQVQYSAGYKLGIENGVLNDLLSEQMQQLDLHVQQDTTIVKLKQHGTFFLQSLFDLTPGVWK